MIGKDEDLPVLPCHRDGCNPRSWRRTRHVCHLCGERTQFCRRHARQNRREVLPSCRVKTEVVPRQLPHEAYYSGSKA